MSQPSFRIFNISDAMRPAALAVLMALQFGCASAPPSTRENIQPLPSNYVPTELPVPAHSAAPSAQASSQKLARGTNTLADQRLAQGDLAFERGEFEAAEVFYQNAYQLNQNDPAPLVGMVRARLSKADVPSEYGAAPENKTLQMAIKDLKQAILLDASFAPAHLELGRAYLVEGRAAESLDALKKAVSLAPHDAEAHSSLGVACLALGKLDDAVNGLARAAELSPGDAERKANLGTALLAAGRVEPALQSYEQAVRLAPQNARIRNDLATAYLAQNEPDKALSHLEAAVAANPQKASYRSNLGYAFHLKKDLAKAIAFYREALQLDPKLNTAWINLGNALAQQGHYKEARTAYEKALENDPTDPRVKAVIDELDALEAKPNKTR